MYVCTHVNVYTYTHTYMGKHPQITQKLTQLNNNKLTHKIHNPLKTPFNAPNFNSNAIGGTKYHKNKNKPLKLKRTRIPIFFKFQIFKFFSFFDFFFFSFSKNGRLHHILSLSFYPRPRAFVRSLLILKNIHFADEQCTYIFSCIKS